VHELLRDDPELLALAHAIASKRPGRFRPRRRLAALARLLLGGKDRRRA
jgi:hypothetical protein